MSDIYYLARGQKVQGPYSRVELMALGESQQILESDLIRRQDIEKWAQATKVKGLKTVTSIATEAQPNKHDHHEAPPQVAVPVDASGSRVSDTVSQLLVIARYQTFICLLVLFYILCGFCIGAGGVALDQNDYIRLGLWIVFTALSIVPLWLMTRALSISKPNSIAYCVCYVIPGIGLIVLFRLSHLASNRLRRAGLKIGLIGVSSEQLLQLQTSGQVRTDPSNDTTATEVGSMRRFGRLLIYGVVCFVILIVALVVLSFALGGD